MEKRKKMERETQIHYIHWHTNEHTSDATRSLNNKIGCWKVDIRPTDTFRIYLWYFSSLFHPFNPFRFINCFCCTFDFVCCCLLFGLIFFDRATNMNENKKKSHQTLFKRIRVIKDILNDAVRAHQRRGRKRKQTNKLNNMKCTENSFDCPSPTKPTKMCGNGNESASKSRSKQLKRWNNNHENDTVPRRHRIIDVKIYLCEMLLRIRELSWASVGWQKACNLSVRITKLWYQEMWKRAHTTAALNQKHTKCSGKKLWQCERAS